MERTLRFFCVSTALIASVAASAAPQYKLHNLGNTVTRFGGATGGNTRISSQNVATFAAVSNQFVRESFMWKNGVRTNTLGLGGNPNTAYPWITDGGILHGPSGYFNGTHLALFPQPFPENFTSLRVESFNDNLIGVGTIVSSTPRDLAYLYENGQGYAGLGPDTNEAYFTSLNNKDKAILVGRGFSGQKAYIYDVPTDSFQDITSMLQGYVFSDWRELRIGDSGIISGFGWNFLPDGSGGYVRKETKIYPFSANNLGHVVQLGGTLGGAYYDGASMWSLRDLVQFPTGATFMNPEDINDNGWIVGTYQVGEDKFAFAMEPVPEPTTMLVLGGGLLSIARRRRNRT